MRPRVLMVGPAEGDLGGIAALVDTVAPVLRSRIELLYMSTAPIDRAARDAGRLSLSNLRSAASQLFRFARALRRFRPEIVHLHTSQHLGWLKDSLFVLATKATLKRAIVHVHAATFDALYGGRPAIERRYTRMVLGRADAIIAVSETWGHRLGQIASLERIHTFVNCIDASSMQTVGVSNDTKPVKAVFLGSIGERKGVVDLIEAIGELKTKCQVAVDIAGYEDTEGYIEVMNQAISRTGLQGLVRFVGVVRGNEKLELLANASLFVLPSYDEGLPIALLEAMASGCAVVTTPVGGIPEVITDGHNGFLVDPGDVQLLADRIQILVEDGALRRSMGEANRAIALSQLDVAPYVDRLVALYNDLMPSED